MGSQKLVIAGIFAIFLFLLYYSIMNEFCRSCPDLRSESCRLPGRLQMTKDTASYITSQMVRVFSPDFTQSDEPVVGLGSPAVSDENMHRELAYPEVVACIERHSTT